MDRPDRSEYADYYHGYVALVPDGDIEETLARQREEFLSRLRGIPEARGDHRYAEGKWTVKELIGHLVDTERVMGFRALAFARGDRTPLPGFEQDDYVAGGSFGARTIADLADEFESLRDSHLILFRSFDGDTWMRQGTASGYEFTTRAVAWIMAGHVMHHAAVLEERYL
jgi:hypothetical protein